MSANSGRPAGAPARLAAGAAWRRPEVAALRPGVPDVAALFAFMRDAELRFRSLRLRLEERRLVAAGELVTSHELLLVHPGRARVTTVRSDVDTIRNHDVWLSDGTLVRTYRSAHGLGTVRPVRTPPVGLDDADLPDASRPYRPLTALPANSLVESFVHPAGLCGNVLATGACRIVGADSVAGREAIVLRCDHPRTIEVSADRPDHRLEMAVDRETGLVARLVESFAGRETRRVTATALEPDAAIPEAAFAVALPADAAMVY